MSFHDLGPVHFIGGVYYLSEQNIRAELIIGSTTRFGRVSSTRQYL